MTHKTKKIYLDLDDVLCDTAGAYIKLVKREFGKTFTLADIHSFNLQESFGLSDEQNNLMFKHAHKAEFTLSLAPFDGVAETLLGWQEKEYEISIVTGRHTSAFSESIQWLRYNNIPFNSFTMVDKYHWPDTDHDIAISLEALSDMSFVFAVEDNITMAEHLSTSMNTRVLLYDRPWNQTLHDSESLRRCRGWRDISETSVMDIHSK